MRIAEIRSIPGPNIYIYKPVIVMRLHLEELTEKESIEFPGFIERLLEALPGVHNHHCAKGKPGGFIERLYGGTYFGHIVEHVCLELTEYAGFPAHFGKTLYAGGPGIYDVIVENKAEEATKFLLQVAVKFVEALLHGYEYPLYEAIEKAKRIACESELGPSTRAIVEAAGQRGIPVYRLNHDSLVQLGTGCYAKRIQATITEQSSCIAVDIASNKELTKTLLERAAIPVPAGGIARSEEEAMRIFASLQAAVVVKPLSGSQGKGVSTQLETTSDVRRAFQIAQQYGNETVVEQFYPGRNYRLLLVNSKLIAGSERIPAHVIGDGIHSIGQLVEIVNEQPERGVDHEKPLTKIMIDPVVVSYLTKHGRRLQDIPKAGEIVYLRESANLSTGGIAIDVTDEIHPEIRKMAERAARVIGLDVCGIDLVAEDITKSIDCQSIAIIEVNAAPGIRMHHFPSIGEKRDVAGAVVDALFPKGTPARIPTVSITGTNGKTTTTRMIGHVMQNVTGKTVGMTTTDGIYINGERIAKGDTTGPRSARIVLEDPSVEIAVLETARGGIVRSGLGYDWADVAVLTNISPDHIGQDGIEEIEDLVHIKSLVAERVRSGGTVILNAEDPNLTALAKRLKQQTIVYFSLDKDHPVVKRHLSIGGTCFYKDGDWLVEASGSVQWKIMHAGEIPVTMYGLAQFHIANGLAAAAACRAQGITREKIAQALGTFSNNPGRANFYKVNKGYVLVDYGHNPDSFKAICKMAGQLQGRRITGVVGVPGDRSNAIVEASARVAAEGFHKLLIKEDIDTRGRERGEIASILFEVVQQFVPYRECKVIYNECEALDTAIREMIPGELVVIFYEKLQPVKQVLENWKAVQVESLEDVSPIETVSASQV
ncbi:cyanophycin synthetase [Fodinisporobacter ferrooxydans]|uniref:Cyanophycin synthetase n=1 Tax=Fodinisporobacter ferrooxydans TaxID=2901836 RepID=A0ABY4CRF1_9BACL|nr:cyanophycin synthetase [Alicyclobacillaceae bacterium MYW30-H2]